MAIIQKIIIMQFKKFVESQIEESLVNSIVENPTDMFNWNAYADFLEENGENSFRQFMHAKFGYALYRNQAKELVTYINSVPLPRVYEKLFLMKYKWSNYSSPQSTLFSGMNQQTIPALKRIIQSYDLFYFSAGQAQSVYFEIIVGNPGKPLSTIPILNDISSKILLTHFVTGA